MHRFKDTMEVTQKSFSQLECRSKEITTMDSGYKIIGERKGTHGILHSCHWSLGRIDKKGGVEKPVEKWWLKNPPIFKEKLM